MAITTLQVMSAYSLLKSTIDLKAYVTRAKQLGYQQLVLTDEGVMHGAVEFYQLCHQYHLKPIIGCQFTYAHWKNRSKQATMIVYAKDEKGYQALLQLSTWYQESKIVTPIMEHYLNQMAQHLQLVFPQANSEWLQRMNEQELQGFQQWLLELSDHYPNLIIGIGIEEFATLPISLEILEPLAAQAALYLLPFVRTAYLQAEDAFSYRVLRAIDQDETLSTTQADVTGIYYLHNPESLEEKFLPYLSGRLVEQLKEFTQTLNWQLSFHQALLPKYPTEKGMSSAERLQTLCQEQLQKRNLQAPVYEKRLSYELALIHQMGFDDYFLIVWDIMRFAHEQNIQTGPGRGSAAGSLVAYLLKITQVDPIQYQLLFERFLNPERFTMPDIDLDFPDNRRDEVLAYVVKKYGADHVAQIATFGTLAAKQAIRDVCRALGLSNAQALTWSRAIPNQLGIKLKEAYEQSKELQLLVQQTPRNQLIFKTACKIEGLPRHLSTHAAGVVLSDIPLVSVVPLMYRDQLMPITQYTMKFIEQIGLLKMDFLGLKNLTILHDALHFTKKLYQKDIKLEELPLDDPSTLHLFQQAKTSGIFQFESDGIRRVLKKLKPTSFEDITAVNALYRPGPMEQIDTFIKRKHGKERVQYPHPVLEDILTSTYGVMVYQEQVMQVTSAMAGFSLGQADILRRAISKKDRQVIEKERQHFLQGASQKGIEEQTALEVYQYIEHFANYGFNRSHAVAYSLLAYQLAYIKVHYPLAFYVAIFRSLSERSSKLQEYLLEAKQKGIQIYPPAINVSQAEYTATHAGIFIGLQAIKGLRRDCVKEIIRNRQANGPYTDFINFALRMGRQYCKAPILEALIDAGAFDEFGMNRASLRNTILSVVESVAIHGNNVPLAMNEDAYPIYEMREADDALTTIDHEIRVLGFPVSPLLPSEYHEFYTQQKVSFIREIYESKMTSLLGVLKEVKKIRTKKGEWMAFATLQDESGTIELIAGNRW